MYLLQYESSVAVAQDVDKSVLILVLGLPQVAGDVGRWSFSKNTESLSPPVVRNDNGDSVGGDGVATDGQVDDGDSGDIIGDSGDVIGDICDVNGDKGDVGEDVSVEGFLLSRGREPFVLILKSEKKIKYLVQ